MIAYGEGGRTVLHIFVPSIFPRSGLAIQLALPDMPPLVIINIHRPFEKAQQHAMDKWLGSFNRVDILMGDFNDKIWEESHKPTRWWHTKLTNKTLQDRAMGVAKDISGLINLLD